MSTGDKNPLAEEVLELWVELGRDPTKLNLIDKSTLQLEDGLEKLKAIKMGFGLLFKEDGNHKLAISLLAEVFLKKENNE